MYKKKHSVVRNYNYESIFSLSHDKINNFWVFSAKNTELGSPMICFYKLYNRITKVCLFFSFYLHSPFEGKINMHFGNYMTPE